MKKIFTFAAAILASVAMMAQTENVGTYSTQVISVDGTTSTWTFILPSSQTTVPAGETEDVGIIYAPSGSSKMKFTSSNQFSWQGQSSGYIPVPAGGAGTISMTVKGSSDSRWLQLYVNGEAAADSKRLWSKYAETPSSDGKKGPQSFTFTAEDLTTKNGQTYLHFKDNNTELKIASFEVVLTSGLYGVPSTDPIAYVTKETLDLKIGRSGLEQKQDSFELKGANLPEGATASIVVPNHAGLSISPATFSINEGAIDQKFVVTYAPLDNEEFNGDIIINAGSFELHVALQCNKLAPQEELVVVDDDIVWDWNGAANADIAPVDANLAYILANTSDNWAESFAADKLEGKAQYFYYNSNKCFQGPMLRFITSVPGKLVIDFSNTGGNRPYRHIFLNGEDTGEKSNSATKATTQEIAVAAGEVKLEGMMEDEGAEGGFSANQLRIYKITFTKDQETGIENSKAEVKAVKFFQNGQLMIEKNGVIYNTQGAIVK